LACGVDASARTHGDLLASGLSIYGSSDDPAIRAGHSIVLGRRQSSVSLPALLHVKVRTKMVGYLWWETNMAQLSRHQRFIQKAEAALLSAIEVYNKPDFRYREETFSILCVNAWELLLKARLLQMNSNDEKCLFVYETRSTKRGAATKKRYLKRNRAGNLQTINLGQTIVALEKKGSAPAPSVRRNLDALVEIRDNSVHFITAGPILSKQVLEVGTAAVANYVGLARQWFGADLSRYHLYLMPIGFISAPSEATSVLVSSDEANLVRFITSLMQEDNSDPSDDYHVALSVQLRMKRSVAEGPHKEAPGQIQRLQSRQEVSHPSKGPGQECEVLPVSLPRSRQPQELKKGLLQPQHTERV